MDGWGRTAVRPSSPDCTAGCIRRTGGRLGHGIIGVPSLLLRTTGRRSGVRRTSALVYGRDGSAFVVAGSNYGGAHDPAWLANLRANPRVELPVARRQVVAVARWWTVGDAATHGSWQLMNRVNRDRYDHYQARTTRPISLVLMSPENAPGAEQRRSTC